MKNIIIAGLLMAFAGNAIATNSEGGNTLDAEVQGNDYLARCTESGNESGLKNEELDEYITSCIQELSEKGDTNEEKDQG